MEVTARRRTCDHFPILVFFLFTCIRVGRNLTRGITIIGRGTRRITEEVMDVGTSKLGTKLKRRNIRGESYGFVKFSSVRDVTKLTNALNNVWFGHFRVRARVASFARNDTTAGSKKECEGLAERDGPKIIQGKLLNKDLRVGEIVVKLGTRQETVEKTKGHKKEGGPHANDPTATAASGKDKERQALLRKYKAKSDDVSWAKKGVVATISNGEAVPVVQTRITDAGFNDMILIPMGADKVFVKSFGGDDALIVINSAKEFFTLLFSHWKRWDFNVQPYKRGAWVRLYGIPVHAWNVEVKVVEEWGYALGEDTCLFEEEVSQANQDEGRWDTEAEKVADTMVGKLVDVLEDEVVTGCPAKMQDITPRADVELEGSQVWELVLLLDKRRVDTMTGRGEKLGGFRHVLSSLKKVARLPSKDSGEVLKILKKTERRRKDCFGTNQLREGNDKVAEDDILEVGNTIEVTFKGDNENRGLGGMEKRQKIRKLVVNQIPSLLCIQETKLQSCDTGVCSSIWGNSPHAFSYCSSVGASGGLLTLWDSSVVDVWASESYESVLWCHGRFIKSGEEFFVANVYALCDFGAKQQLWDSLLVRIQALGRSRACVCGDFNVVRSVEERRSASGRGDGISMSRLYRFLLSGEWCLTWPNFTQVARMRGLSDHCPIVLDKWNFYQVDGWGGGRDGPLYCGGYGASWCYVRLTLSLSRLNASICWQQSRWLKEGDANTKYFHSVLANRRRGNAISSLQVGGITVEGVAPIRHAVVSHFASHFKAEVKAVVWDCDSFKSLGPDGVNFGFIEDFWTEMQGDVMRFITEFHRNGRLTKGINATFIALIPKVDSPQRLNDFRHISLVGSLYKILAKFLANRLRLVMGGVISESQTTFVRDRQILDGVLIANEVVDEARRAKKELLLFKVDFEKAYDSVDWGYLDVVMGRMGFPTLWRKWIKECVCTATASVLVNGSPTNEFPLKRGLRVGNSVSISVSHLQFADDTLLMGTKC
ncbi:hypothetical protein TSUD_178910 [Trifolium subterraneum]|uniref:Uncharacterized protein n=1 Tax=Trifolium subterraneum TaxID=3900 RepID=A0A2Z6LMN6_TRISU|nr:hypothetical protein TSUD_178910 [Trifolium subterraneum]